MKNSIKSNQFTVTVEGLENTIISKKVIDSEKKAARMELLTKLWTDSYNLLDKQIVYLAGGGLIFTMGFGKEIIEFKEIVDSSLLTSSWLFFTFALILNLFTHFASIWTMEAEMEGKNSTRDRWNVFIKISYITCALFLIIGISLFTYFTFLNF